MSTDPNEFLLSGGITSVKFAKVGDSVTGTITRQPEMQQQRDYDSGALLFWDDGKPRNQIRVILQTEERDSTEPDDTGERALFIKSGIRTAVADAIRAAGAKGLEVGGTLWVKFHAEGEVKKKGMHPPKLYQAKYKSPAVPVTTLQEAGPADPALIASEAPF